MLEAIEQGATLDLTVHERWVAAFKAISWAIETESGLQLTTAGRQAHSQAAAAGAKATVRFEKLMRGRLHQTQMRNPTVGHG